MDYLNELKTDCICSCEYRNEKNDSKNIIDQNAKKWIRHVLDSLNYIVYIILNIMSFNYINGMIMLLYKYYCQREHFCVRENLENIVKQQGYELETYELPTNDNYMLVLHRIQGKSGEHQSNKYPVFLQHGLLCSSADFLLEDCMAYTFANSGRDVWLGNFRGNIFSRKYPSRKQSVVDQRVNNKNFWHFSFDEHGDKDLPEMINFVLTTTGSSKLVYVGHSMGTTAFFTMINLHPELADRIHSAHLMAPVADLSVVRGVPSLFTPCIAEFVMHAFEALGIHTLIFPRLIKGYSLLATIVLFVCGYHDLTIERLLQILQFAPSGSSTKTLLHYLQCHRSQKLIPYKDVDISMKIEKNAMILKNSISFEDRSRSSESECSDDGYKSAHSISSEESLSTFLKEANGLHVRNSIEDMEGLENIQIPHDSDTYSLKRIFIPTSIWWGEADWAASKVNISRIVRELPNVVNCYKMEKSTCGHLDFLWGRTGSFYQDLNKHLDDTYPSDWEELEDQLNYVHDNITVDNSKDNAVLWYIHAMSANMRFSLYQFKRMVDTGISSINFF